MEHPDLQLNHGGLSVADALASVDETAGFSSETVAPALVHEILEVAKRSPSGVNVQPWSVYVAQTRTLASLSAKVLAALSALASDPLQESEFLGRLDSSDRAWLGPALEAGKTRAAGLAGVEGHGDADPVDPAIDVMSDARDYFRFLDAPTALIFTISKNLGRGSFLDYGMFLQNIRLSARSRKLNTVRQSAWKGFEDIVLETIGASSDELLVCVMPLGYSIPGSRPLPFQAKPQQVEEFAIFLGS